MKKTKLIIDYEFDFGLIGITSIAKGYKLAWEMNQLLGTHLIKQPDLLVGFKNDTERGFAHFSYQTVTNHFRLFRNRPTEGDNGKFFLVPEFPHYDFILLARMASSNEVDDNLLTSLRNLPDVQLASIIPLEGLKSKSNFVF